MDYSLLGEVCELVADRDYYHNRGIFLFYNSIVPSIREKKFFILRRDGKLIGFCNYAFLTREEIDEATYEGSEIFSRNSGKILHFCTLVSPTGS
jgi:hemolysin-activating ACP:hemolysin acyltransferase